MGREYNLQSNEVVFLKSDGVAHNKSTYVHELLLTNQHLVWTEKGMFGKVKQIHVYDLNQIKIFDNKAQAIAVNDSISNTHLNVYFLNGEEIFKFSVKSLHDNNNDANVWGNKINSLLTDNDSELYHKRTIFGTGAAVVAESLKDTVGSFKDSMKNTESFSTRKKKSKIIKCPSCGAPLSGSKGEMVQCDYCDTKHLIK